MIDFMEITPNEGEKYGSVMVHMWSKQVEAFPSSKQNRALVAKVLPREIIPCWGIPAKISSDHCIPFVNEAIA